MRWAKELYSLGSIKGEKLEQLYLFTSVLGHHQVDEEVSGTDLSKRIYMPPTRQLVGNKSCARNVPKKPPEIPWGRGYIFSSKSPLEAMLERHKLKCSLL